MKSLLQSIGFAKRVLSVTVVSCIFLALLFVFSILGMKYLSIAVFVCGIVIPVVFGIYISRITLSAIAVVNTALEELAHGNLTKRLDETGAEEFNEMAKHFNAAVERLYKTVGHFTNMSYIVSSNAHDVDASSREMIAGTDQAVAQISSVAAAGEEMSTTSAEISRNCLSAAKSSERASESAATGQTIADNTLSVMNRIDQNVKGSAEIIRGLGERSTEIGGVISLINDIADQTNLLALNAAIEAARAGEHGRGFAVVADEVRKLAEKTTEATKHIGDTIKAMQSETRQAVVSMEEGVSAVELGSREAKKSDVALKDILQQINVVGSEVSQIATASEQQTATTDELAHNIQSISELVQQVAKILRLNAERMSQVAKLSLDTQRVVTQFKMASPEDARQLLEKAVAYHRQYGREKAFQEFSNPKGEFIKNGLYIVAQDFNGTLILNGADRSRVGTNLINTKDPKGVFFVKDLINLARTRGNGEYECAHLNFTTNLVQQKVYYVQRMDGDYYLSCGAYK
ncbi:MAG TPA: methyl-accepting chemotaxis protein [Syntrophorhabdaceae bacterium]|nr:methyl-accepting chemotaxis protein [Syntrophorhabdaceae bacterium]